MAHNYKTIWVLKQQLIGCRTTFLIQLVDLTAQRIDINNVVWYRLTIKTKVSKNTTWFLFPWSNRPHGSAFLANGCVDSKVTTLFTLAIHLSYYIFESQVRDILSIDSN